EAYNIEPALLLAIASTGNVIDFTAGTFTLDVLKKHNVIEHDASISRSDFLLGDNLHFNETIYTALAQSNPSVSYYNTTSAGQVIKQRIADDRLANPKIFLTPVNCEIHAIESALYLSVMGDPSTGVAPKRLVDIFFREERMPFGGGWNIPSMLINEASLLELGSDIVQASGDDCIQDI
ncbi:uncharacterized protein BT62DRAFT_890121, partial [Guyanagaster necrorhizus]